MILPNDASPLETLLANRSTETHDFIANLLWESVSNEDAVKKLQQLAESHKFKEILLNGGSKEKEDEVLTNLPKGKAGKWEKRRGRKPAPKRTEEEIAKIRAERAAKKKRILEEGGVLPYNPSHDR